MNPTFLGLDSSTQSLTALVLEQVAPAEARVVLEESIRFDEELPQWKTRDGQLENVDPAVGQAPPLMWVDALELLLARITSRTDLTGLNAIAVSGQQHGSVYLNRTAQNGLAALSPRAPLADQLSPLLSRPVAPIWTDSSSGSECAEIRNALGGAVAAAELTGSDLFERFTAPQIRRFARQDPEGWAATAHIALVSSFVTSVLAGTIAPIDWGDAAGTNLLNFRKRRWSKAAMDATAPHLSSRLPQALSARHVVGPISSFFVDRFGFPATTNVVIGAGDNPSSALGVGLLEAGNTLLSLGTSDTLSQLGRAQLGEAQPGGTQPGEGLRASTQAHLFVAPTGHDMSLLCLRNGAQVRDGVRAEFGLDWHEFEHAVEASPPGNDGHILLPWAQPEIAPRTTGRGFFFSSGFPREDKSKLCRAVLEGQALALHRHANNAQDVREIRVTGGASASNAMLQIVADVFDATVIRFETTNGAALGAALRAALSSFTDLDPWSSLVRSVTKPIGSQIRPQSSSAYRQLSVESKCLEALALKKRGA